MTDVSPLIRRKQHQTSRRIPTPPPVGGWVGRETKVGTVGGQDRAILAPPWVGGWAARLRQSPACLGRGVGSFLPGQSPEPLGPAQTLLSWERHKRSRGSDTTNHRHTPPRQSRALPPPPIPPQKPVVGWVVERELPDKETGTIVFRKTRVCQGGKNALHQNGTIHVTQTGCTSLQYNPVQATRANW